MVQYGDNELLNRAKEEREREREREQMLLHGDPSQALSEAEQGAQAEQTGTPTEAQQSPRSLPAWVRTLRSIATGEVLVGEGASKIYDRLIIIMLLFLGSIAMHFWAIKTDSTLSRLTKEVDLLHERAIRKREQCYQQCSHSSIVERLKERGIELYDPLEPSSIIRE
ncbi:MAG: hypothetical protein IJ348_01305 [Alistipes sp.]|nr:hypothetical protein [Alistipes sp.]